MKDSVISFLSKQTGITQERIEQILEIPKDTALGDYAFPCFILAKERKKAPHVIAQEFAQTKKLPAGILKLQAVGPYLNIFIDALTSAQDTLATILKQKEKYGQGTQGKGKKFLIEHTSINPNASPHVGRARNALIGDSLVRIIKNQGFKPETHYFVNDVGKQIALLLLAAEKKKKVSFHELLNLYIDINKKVEKDLSLEKKAFEKLHLLEKGNKKVKKQFKDLVAICVKGQAQIFKELDIVYDVYDYESRYLESKRTNEILKALDKTGKLFEDNEGRMALDLKGFDLPLENPVFIVTRADKTSLYGLRDIAYTIDKMHASPHHNLIVLGEDQKTYFQEVKAALSLLKESAPEPVHYSFVLLSGEKMATRQGNVVLLEDFMQEARAKARGELKQRYGKADEIKEKAIAYAAIKYAMLKVSSDKNVTFDMDKALSFEGDTGPYLLYAYARARSVLTKAHYKPSKTPKLTSLTTSEKALLTKLAQFPDACHQAYDQRTPHVIAGYAFQLAQAFNEFYHAEQIIGSNEQATRCALVHAYTQTLKNALLLLGITPLEAM